MSEYQFYEFRTVNRTLTRHEQDAVSSWSSRTNATPTGAKFVYHYGDFRHDPEKCLLDYFDMMLYHANYGCRRIMMRFPKKVVDIKDLKPYRYNDGEYSERNIKITLKGEYVVIDIEENLQDGGYEDWVECEDTLGSITSLWTDITRGDYRSLYLIWVHFAQLKLEYEGEDEDYDEEDDDEGDMQKEPPVPSGLQTMTGALSAFAQFWWISDDLITAASKASPIPVVNQIDFKKAIALLSDAEKSSFLLQFVQDEAQVKTQLIKKLEGLSGIETPQYQKPQRTIQDIRDSAIKIEQDRLQHEKEAAIAKRQEALKNMAKREDKMWAEVYEHLDVKIASSYDKAVTLLVDLKDLAAFLDKTNSFNKQFDEILARYGRSATLLKRFKAARLMS